MEDTKLLKILVGVTLLLALINVFGTYTLYTKFAAISQTLPSKDTGQPAQAPTNEPTQPTQPAQPSADDDPVKGAGSAPVTIIEFSDFECSYCARFVQQTMPQIEQKYIQTGKVKLVFRDYPLAFHQSAQKAAEATECADLQGKYWEYHDKLFANQKSLSLDNLKQYAKGLGLDAAKFNECLDSGQMTAEVKKDYEDGSKSGVTGTPAFFINGKKIVGAQPFATFEQAIEEALKK